jgi:geranylgeranyl diphosphate synthase, type I
MMIDLMLDDENLKYLGDLQALHPEVRDYVRQRLPPDWPELAHVLSGILDEPSSPLSILPLASCAAVGGVPREAVPVAAAWEVFSLGMRILDDLEDQDRSDGLWVTVGVPRALNFSATLYAFAHQLLLDAPWSADLFRHIGREFIEGAMRLAAGQDRDLCEPPSSVEEYWQLIEAKNASAFALACAAGARCGTQDERLVNACSRYGYHLGLALQLFDDFEGLWFASERDDLSRGKITLPVLYGLTVPHEGRAELRRLIDQGDLAAHRKQICEILDNIRTRDFMIWTALQERDRALGALAECIGQMGVTALAAYVTVIFAHVEEILE